MTDYEQYIEENGLPYCDYRIYRHKHLKLTPFEKFRFGIRRIISILKSYKQLDLKDLLESVKAQIQKEKESKNGHRKSIMLRGGHVPPEQRAEQIYLSLKSEMAYIDNSIKSQNDIVIALKEEFTRELREIRNSMTNN